MGRLGVRKEDGRLLPCFDRAHVGREGRCRDVTSGGKVDMPRWLRTRGREGADWRDEEWAKFSWATQSTKKIWTKFQGSLGPDLPTRPAPDLLK